ncbi:TPA: hypothetical protein N0F65_010397 [Lagenidium giganteum]|uniref:Uncharacterized protein n=1 Tax=Lagenidium giganteum TaxID=4803 RepID=A0AAV2YQK4_9STRA|nr:TPA: hypothetical protein N0F65_010397 [Lagenidium giganteum]
MTPQTMETQPETQPETPADRIKISDSQIVLSPQDKNQLIQSIADALVTGSIALRARKADDSLEQPEPAIPIFRDAFLYSRGGVFRIGWRYPLAYWTLYGDIVHPGKCGYGVAAGKYFYC